MHLYQGTTRAVHRRRDAGAPREHAVRPFVRRVPVPPGAVRGHVVAQLAERHGPRPPGRRPDRPGHPRRAEAAAELEAPRRHDHRLQPDHRRRLGRHRRAQAVDRGRPLEHHRLRHRRLRRQAARHAPSVAPGRAVPALPPGHAPRVLGRPGDRARCLRLPALRAARPEVAAVPRRLRRPPRHEPGLHRRPGRRVRDLPRRSASPVPTKATILDRVAATAFKPHKRLLDHVARVIRNEPTFTLLDEQLVAYNAILDSVRAPARTSRTSSSSSKAAPAPASRSSRSTSSPSWPSAGSARST